MTHHPLYPFDHGAIARITEQAKFLSKNGFHVHVVGGNTSRRGLAAANLMMGADAHLYSSSLVRALILFAFKMIYRILGRRTARARFKSSTRLHKLLLKYDLAHIINRVEPDAIQCDYSYLVESVLDIARASRIPIVHDKHNVEYHIFAQIGYLAENETANMKKYESDLCNAADVVTVTSKHDMHRLQTIGVYKKMNVVPNGVAYHRYQVSHEDTSLLRRQFGIAQDDTVLVFHGTLEYRPNFDARELILRYIFPELSTMYAALKLLLIGPQHRKRMRDKVLELPTIPFDEFPRYLSMGDVGIVPLTAGSGTRLKIIEYLALGIPTISTGIGAEGLPVTDGYNIILAKDANRDFVDKCATLLGDKRLQYRISRNGRRLAKKLDWNQILERDYLEIYRNLVGSCVSKAC